MKNVRVLTLAILMVAATIPASATQVQSWFVTAAEGDEFGQFGDGHAFFMPENWGDPGIPGGPKYLFEGAGTLDEYLDDSGNRINAHLYGNIVDENDSNNRWAVSVWFDAVGPGSGSPKKELMSSAYTENGGPVDTSTWEYYALRSDAGQGEPVSQLIGLNNNLDIILDLFQEPDDGSLPFQIGEGANGKNVKMGMSGWFTYLQADNSPFSQPLMNLVGFVGEDPFNGRGDINVNLVRKPVIPEPATMGAIGLGLAGSALVKRRRKV